MRRSTQRNRIASLAALLTAVVSCAPGDDALTVAVASNFAETARELAVAYEEQSGVPIRLTVASTGTLYAQIVNGAPYDVFLAADSERPGRMEESGRALPGSRLSYAVGQLVLWLPNEAPGCDVARLLESSRRIAIANPDTAPYGAAARAVLESFELAPLADGRVAYGENIAQAFQFAATGNADAAFIAASQSRDVGGCTWRVPASAHPAIDQQAVVLRAAAKLEQAAEFMVFLKSDEARSIIERHGYLAGDAS